MRLGGLRQDPFAMTFLYNGAVEYDEPGVFIAFEEQPEELIKNVGSLKYDLQKLIDREEARDRLRPYRPKSDR